jgi:N-acetylmuramoyl-L-alanine amidase
MGSGFSRLCLLCFVTHLLSLPAANPVSAKQFLVAVDVGHSKTNVGATSATGIGEYDFNESLAKLLLSRVPRDGRKMLSLINEGIDDMPLKVRAETAGAMGADLLISIHHDSVLPDYLTPWVYNGRTLFYCDRFRGFAIFYSENDNDRGRSLQFARLLGSALVGRNLSPSQHHAEMTKGEGKAVIDAQFGVFRYDGLAVLKNAKMPAVLLECGIIVNREEEKRLRDGAYKNRIVSAILKSIDVFSGAGKL